MHIIKCETPLSRPLFPWRAPGEESRRQAFHFKAVLTQHYSHTFGISDFLCTCTEKHGTRRPLKALADRTLFFCSHFSFFISSSIKKIMTCTSDGTASSRDCSTILFIPSVFAHGVHYFSLTVKKTFTLQREERNKESQCWYFPLFCAVMS